MKKKIICVAILATLCSCSSDDFSESVESAPIEYSEWDYSVMPKMPEDFTPTERDYDNISCIADLIFENWNEFHNWEMPEDIIEGYTSKEPTFTDLWNVISWSMVQESFGDTIGETDWFIEFWEQYGETYWK